MIKLRKQIQSLLKAYHPRIYFNRASEQAEFIYIVYDLPNSFTNEEQEIFNLDVDIWDNKADTTNIEILADYIWRGLHKHRHIDDDMQFSIYRMNRLNIEEDDERIARRKLIFELRYFDRGLNNE